MSNFGVIDSFPDGYDYECLSPPVNGSRCPIKPVPFRGCNCSDVLLFCYLHNSLAHAFFSQAAGTQHAYADVMSLLANNATAPGRMWDSASSTPYFHYFASSATSDEGQRAEAQQSLHEVWYDDPQSLALRYANAKALGWRGIGTTLPFSCQLQSHSVDCRDVECRHDGLLHCLGPSTGTGDVASLRSVL